MPFQEFLEGGVELSPMKATGAPDIPRCLQLNNSGHLPFKTLKFEHVVFSRMFARFCFDYRWYLIEKQPDDLVSRVFEIFLSNRTTEVIP